MADNYIEKQQEQYEARKAAWKQSQKYGKKKPGNPKSKVLLKGGSEETKK